MRATCRKCCAVFSGRSEHCTICHRTFTGSTSGDRHRVGTHGVDRRCRSDSELSKVGLVINERGQWGFPAADREWWTA